MPKQPETINEELQFANEDIADSNRASDALTESEERFSAIVKQMTAGIVQSDLTGKIVLANDRFCEIVGYEREELFKMRLHDLTHEEDLPPSAERFARTATQGEPFAVEKRYVRKDGSPVWIHNTVSAITGADGKPKSILAVTLDITGRKSMEAALRESERRVELQSRIFDTTLSSITDFAYTFDREGRFIYANQALLDLWGLKLEDAVGKNFYDLNYPDDLAARLQRQIQQVLDTGQGLKDETPYTSPTGAGGFYEYILNPVTAADGTVEIVAGSTRDITEREQAEEEIKRLSERNRDILESITDGFFTLDRDWRFTYVNRQAEILVNRQSSDLLGKVFWEVYPTVIDSPFEKMYRRAMNEGIAGTVTDFYPDHQRFYEVSVHPSQNGVTVYFRNVTERKQAEAVLRESEQFNQDVIDSLALHLSVVDKDGVITAVNEAWRQFAIENGLDATMQGVGIGTNYLDVCRRSADENDDEEAAAISEGLSDILDGKRDFFTLEYPCHSPDCRRWFLLTISPLTHGRGAVITHLNITKRRLAEAALRESEERYRSLFNSIDEGFSTVEMIFDENEKPVDYRFLELNPVFEQLTGLENAAGKSALELVPDLEDFWFETYGRVALTGESVRFENHSEPMNRWFDVFASRIGDDASRKVAIVFTNITDRKQAEEERERSFAREQAARVEAEAANHLKDEFLATLSHELRTPLTSILGWTRLLQTNDFDAERSKHALETVERNARAQNQLIDDLLDVSRIITGKLRLDVSPVELSIVIEAAVDAVRPAAEARDIRLRMSLDSSAGAVSGDADRLQQVIWNLLTNAVKFTPKGGRVEVRLKRVNSHVEIVVSDTGQGIAPQFLPHVFDRFRQADQSTTRTHGGLGLGLSIVRQLVEQHGGTVGVESEGVGQGTTFTVKLPRLVTVRRREANKTERGHPTSGGKIPFDCAPSLEGLRVLVVDDEPDTRELLRAVLESCDSVVTTAGSAAEALAALAETKHDVLVCDIGMPEEDGYSLIGKVRALPAEQGGRTPAIALTAYARAEDRVRALMAGFQVHLPKPIEPVELAAVVASLAGRTGQV